MTVPDWRLERYRLGELSEAERASVEAQLTEADHARLAELDADDDAILRRYPPRVMAADAHDRMRRRRRRVWAPALGGGLVVATIAVAALVVLAGPGPGADPTLPFGIDAGDGHRLKGDARLLVHRMTAAGDEQLDVGAGARAGDVLQVEVVPGGESFAVVVSIDGNGNVTRHLPIRGDEAVAVEPGKTVALPRAYTLDDAPHFERFFLVAADAPFSVQPIVDAAQTVTTADDPSLTPLSVADGLTVREHLIRKESR